MTKKLFSFINSGSLRVGPKTKIIPAEEFSTLKNANDVLDHALSDAEEYKIKVSQECETLKENAYKEGYEDGFKEWADLLVKLETEISNVNQDIHKMVLPVALKAARKIVGKELELNQETIVDIVLANIKGVAQHKKVIIFVNKNDWEAVEKNKNRLKEQFEDLQSLSIRPRDDVEPGGCIIETEIGIINAQMEHRWQVLEKAFEKLIKPSPESTKGS